MKSSALYEFISERPLLRDSSVHNEDSEGGSDDSEDVGVYVECFGSSGATLALFRFVMIYTYSSDENGSEETRESKWFHHPSVVSEEATRPIHVKRSPSPHTNHVLVGRKEQIYATV